MEPAPRPRRDIARTIGRWSLAGFLVLAGTGHFVATDEFLAQVPPFLPWPTAIVLVSGVVEIGLGVALVALPRHRALVGWLTAALFIAVFPGNVAQAVTATPAFGLETDAARWTRLAFQPLLVLWALWSTRAWSQRPWASRASALPSRADVRSGLGATRHDPARISAGGATRPGRRCRRRRPRPGSGA